MDLTVRGTYSTVQRGVGIIFRSYVIAPDGRIVASYVYDNPDLHVQKMHLS